MKFSFLSFLTLCFLLLIACNPKKENDLAGFYLDEYQIDLLEVRKKNDSIYLLSNHSSELEMRRFGNTLKGLIKATGLRDTLFFKFTNQDTVIHELWKNQTSYFRTDSVTATKIRQERSQANHQLPVKSK